MQFLSQALGWADCLVLAMAPLGIITILVSAIRVGGPSWLKAIIGRAKENTAAAEIELMSSTSPEVCELYNGDGIVRCQGKAPVWEFICICPSGFDHKASNLGLGLKYMTLEKAIANKLLKERKRDIESSLFSPNFLTRKFQHKLQPRDSEGMTGQSPTTEHANETTTPQNGVFRWVYKSLPTTYRRSGRLDIEGGRRSGAISDSVSQNVTIIRDTSPNAPNISLNLRNSHERAGIRFTALLGIFLQAGVLIFFGVISYYPKVEPDFQKDNKPAARFAFPLATSGTVLLVFGVFVCALVVENSTEETLYTANNGSTFLMCWLQQGQTVSDQVFDSFAISQSLPRTVITKSARGKDLRIKHRDGRNSILEIATIFGVLVGLVGFIIQFIGLRAMNSAASLVQLGAVGIMTICRALIRPGFARSFETAQLLPGFELNSLAWKLVTTRSPIATSPTGESHATSDQLSPREKEQKRKNTIGWWIITTGKKVEYEQLVERKDITTTAQELIKARREVCNLTNFQGRTSEIAINLALSIEEALTVLFPAGIKGRQSRNPLNEVSWLMDVSYSESSSATITQQRISIDLSYSDGNWQVPADSLDAVLSLWTHTIRAQDEKQQQLGRDDSTILAGKGDSWLRRKIPRPSLRLLGPHEQILKEQLLQDFELWVPHCLKTLVQFDEVKAEEPERNINEYDRGRVVSNTKGAIKGQNQTRSFKVSPLFERSSFIL